MSDIISPSFDVASLLPLKRHARELSKNALDVHLTLVSTDPHPILRLAYVYPAHIQLREGATSLHRLEGVELELACQKIFEGLEFIDCLESIKITPLIMASGAEPFSTEIEFLFEGDADNYNLIKHFMTDAKSCLDKLKIPY